MKKVYKIVLLILTFSILLTGCYDSREVDDEVYAIAIGVDIGKNDMLNIRPIKGPGAVAIKAAEKEMNKKTNRKAVTFILSRHLQSFRVWIFSEWQYHEESL